MFTLKRKNNGEGYTLEQGRPGGPLFELSKSEFDMQCHGLPLLEPGRRIEVHLVGVEEGQAIDARMIDQTRKKVCQCGHGPVWHAAYGPSPVADPSTRGPCSHVECSCERFIEARPSPKEETARPVHHVTTVECESCGFVGSISNYLPAGTAYIDIRCPRCKSTENQHNRDYLEQFHRQMSEPGTPNEPAASNVPVAKVDPWSNGVLAAPNEPVAKNEPVASNQDEDTFDET